MGRLINCLQKVTGKDKVTKQPLMDHVVKRGLIAQSAKLMATQDITVQEADMTVIREARNQAAADAVRVEAALKAQPKAKPTAQASVNRPVDRDEATKEAFERMRAHPEQKVKLAQDVRTHFERIRQETKDLEANVPPVELENPEEQLTQLEGQEELAHQNLDIEKTQALTEAIGNIETRLADRIMMQGDPTKHPAMEREAKAVARTVKRGIENRYAEKHRAITKDFQRQAQILKIKVREKNLAATKEGKQTERELRKIRAFSEFNALLEALPPSVRGEIGGVTTLAQLRSTPQSIGQFLAGRIDKMDKELEKYFRDIYREQIDTMLTAAKAKKATSGVKKSRIGADAQDVVDRVTEYSKMTTEQVAALYEKIESALASGTWEGKDIDSDMEGMLALMQHELSMFGDTAGMTAGELEAAYNSLKQTIKDGRSAWGAIEEARLAEKKRKVDEFLTMLPMATSPEIAAANDKKFRNWLSTYIAEHYTASQFIGKLAPGLSYAEGWHNESRRADSADIDMSIDVTKRLQETLRAALGKNSALAVGKALQAMEVRNVSSPGGNITQLEAMQYLFTWGQTAGQERMTKQGWLPDHIKALQDATSSKEAQALMQFMLTEYQRIGDLADPVHVRHYGMHMPRHPNYAPMYHHPAGVEKEGDPLGGVFATAGLTPRSLKARVNHNAPIKAVSALEVFTKHVSEMGHWIAFADIMRDMRGVMNDRTVKMALQSHLGTKGATDFSTHLDTLARGGVARAAETSAQKDLMNFFLGASAQTALAFNPLTVLKQADAGMRWMFAVAPRRWIPAVLNRTWMTNLPVVWSSPTIQRRILEGMDPLMRQVMQSSNLTPGALVHLARAGFIPMKYMDALGTTMTAAIVYTDALAQNMSHEQAMDAMDDAVARYAQPLSVASKSRVESQGGVFWKTMFLFMSDLRLKSALAMEAIDDIKNGRNLEMAFGRLFTLQIAGVMTQMLANVYAHALDGDDDDDDDYWLLNNIVPVMLSGPFAGLWGLGTIFASTATWLSGEKTYAKQDPITATWDRAKRTVSGAHYLFEGREWNDQKFVREIENIAKSLGMVPGLGPLATGAANVYKTAAGATRQLEE